MEATRPRKWVVELYQRQMACRIASVGVYERTGPIRPVTTERSVVSVGGRVGLARCLASQATAYSAGHAYAIDSALDICDDLGVDPARFHGPRGRNRLGPVLRGVQRPRDG